MIGLLIFFGGLMVLGIVMVVVACGPSVPPGQVTTFYDDEGPIA